MFEATATLATADETARLLAPMGALQSAPGAARSDREHPDPSRGHLRALTPDRAITKVRTEPITV